MNLTTILKNPNNINETKLKKEIYSVIRNCIKNKQNGIEIENYYFSIDIDDIYIRYSTPSNLITVSPREVVYATERSLNVKYFCISNKKKDSYPVTNPALQVTGRVINTNGSAEVEYVVELVNYSKKDTIENYLKANNNTKVLDDYVASICYEVNVNTPLIDFNDYLDFSKIQPVYLNYKEDKYESNIPEIQEEETFSIYIPNISDKILIMQKMLNYIVEFYKEHYK